MIHPSARPADELETVIETYGNLLFRLCLITLGNVSDAEDAVQETLLKYIRKPRQCKAPTAIYCLFLRHYRKNIKQFSFSTM